VSRYSKEPNRLARNSRLRISRFGTTLALGTPSYGATVFNSTVAHAAALSAAILLYISM